MARGRQPGEFYGVHSIATDSKGNIYTTETYRGQRAKFTYKGLALTKRSGRGLAEMIQFIRDIFANASGWSPVVSFEFFPTKTDEGERALLEKTIPALRTLNPDFAPSPRRRRRPATRRSASLSGFSASTRSPQWRT